MSECSFGLDAERSRAGAEPDTIDNRHGNWSARISMYTICGEILAPSDAISLKDLSFFGLISQSRASITLGKEKSTAVLTLGSQLKLGFGASSRGDTSTSYGLKLSNYAGVHHHWPITWFVRRDWCPRS